jgi:hypothetical protein
MRDERQIFTRISPATPPRGLFSRIIKRLGLEKQLDVARGHLEFFVPALLVFVFLSIFAFIGLKQVLTQSSFGPFLSLIFSDPKMVLKYWQSFLLSIFESMPGAYILFFLIPLALFLLFVRLAGIYFEKLSSLIKLINKQKHQFRHR